MFDLVSNKVAVSPPWVTGLPQEAAYRRGDRWGHWTCLSVHPNIAGNGGKGAICSYKPPQSTQEPGVTQVLAESDPLSLDPLNCAQVPTGEDLSTLTCPILLLLVSPSLHMPCYLAPCRVTDRPHSRPATPSTHDRSGFC